MPAVSPVTSGRSRRYPAAFATELADCDEATTAQAASVLRARNAAHFESTCGRLIASGPPAVSRGMNAYATEWQRSIAADSATKPP